MVETRETMQLSNKLYNAIKENNLQEVKECIIKAKSKGVIRIINFKDRNDKSPLERAVKNENLEIARFLIENGADINIQDYLRHPPIYYAVRNGSKEMLELLVSNGAKDYW